MKRLLLADEPATRGIYNLIFGRSGARPTWVRVDDRRHPKAVLCRCWWLTLYAADRGAGRSLLDRIPDRWWMNFSATPAWVHSYIRRKRKVAWVNHCYGYALMHPSRLAVYRRHRVGFLRPDDSRAVARRWPYHQGRGDSLYIKQRIRQGPTAAIRCQGRLVAWALTHTDGSMGFLHVLKPWRGQGMARTISTALAQRVMRRGIMPFVFIEKRNRASIRLTESMGLERVGSFVWFGARPAD